jgi:hypothetical protein
LYWQAAGKDYTTGKKSYLLQEFERKYKDLFSSNGTIQFHQYLAKFKTDYQIK